jgi:hypothetical protein
MDKQLNNGYTNKCWAEEQKQQQQSSSSKQQQQIATIRQPNQELVVEDSRVRVQAAGMHANNGCQGAYNASKEDITHVLARFLPHVMDAMAM